MSNNKPEVLMINGMPVLQYTETDSSGNTFTVKRFPPKEVNEKKYIRAKPTRNYRKK